MSKRSKQNPIVLQIIRQLTHKGKKHPGAILLTGEWGVGKTHLWKTSIQPALKSKKTVYVSLFGVSSVAELKSRIMTNLLGQMASDSTGWKGSLNWGVNIAKSLPKVLATGLNEIAKGKYGTDVLSYLEGLNIDLDPLQMFPSDVIICFDDLERTGLATEDVLGVICTLMEQKGARVLLIANEHRLVDEKERNLAEVEKYRAFKEKVVWLTLTWNTPLSEVYDHFVQQLCEKPKQAILKGYRSMVLDTFSVGECPNLRTLQRALRSLEELLSVKNLTFDQTHLRFAVALIIEDTKTGKIAEDPTVYNGSKYHFATITGKKKPEELTGEAKLSYDFYNRYFEDKMNFGYSVSIHGYIFSGILNVEQLLNELAPPDTKDEGVRLLQEVQNGNWMFADDDTNKKLIGKVVGFLNSTAATHIGVAIRLRGYLGRISRHLEEPVPDVEAAMEKRIATGAKIPDQLDSFRHFNDEEEVKDVTPFFDRYKEVRLADAITKAKSDLVNTLRSGQIAEYSSAELKYNQVLLKILSDPDVIDAADSVVMKAPEAYFRFYDFSIEQAKGRQNQEGNDLIKTIRERLAASASSKQLDKGGRRRNQWLQNRLPPTENSNAIQP